MAALNKSQTTYIACRDRGMTHSEALSLVSAGPMARSRMTTWRAFTAWAKAWDEAESWA